MTENNISCIFGYIREAFGDSATRIPNIYIISCDNGRHGVVDTSREYDCLVNCRFGTSQSFPTFFFFFFFFLFYFGIIISIVVYTLFIFYCFCLFVFFFMKPNYKKQTNKKKQKKKNENKPCCICCSCTIIKDAG